MVSSASWGLVPFYSDPVTVVGSVSLHRKFEANTLFLTHCREVIGYSDVGADFLECLFTRLHPIAST